MSPTSTSTPSESSAFAAIVWKEVRESTKWVVIAAAVTSLATYWTLHDNPGMDGLSTSSAISAVIVGITMGFCVMMTERRGDRWGFLVHRPATRTTIFLGKFAGGVVLFLAAYLLPVLFGLLWLRNPRWTGEPFDWGMARPIVVDAVTGMMFVAAAMLTGMREAKWYASRGLPLVTALVVATVGGWGFTQFSVAVVAATIGMVVMAIAAWGNFMAGGSYEPQPRVARTATVAIIGAGIVIVGAVVVPVFLDATTFDEAKRSTASSALSVFVVATDGELRKIVRHSPPETVDSINLMDGQLDAHFFQPRFRGKLSEGLRVESTALGRSVILPVDPDYRSTDGYFQELGSGRSQNGRATIWHYLFRDRLIVLYDKATGDLVGWAGPDGFTSSVEPPRHRFASIRAIDDVFAGPSDSTGYEVTMLVTADTAYRIDFRTERVERVFAAPPGDTIVGTMSLHTRAGGGGSFAAFVTPRSVAVVSPTAPTFVTPRDPRAAGYERVQVARLGHGPAEKTFISYSAASARGPRGNHRRSVPTIETAYAADGHVLWSYSPVVTAEEAHVAPRDSIAWGVVTPLAVRVGEEMYARQTAHPLDTPIGDRRHSTIAWMLALVMSLLAAVLAFVRARTYAFSAARTVTWTVLGLVFGLVGVLVMLAMFEWPAREPCPVCKRQRVVTREQCEHCAGAFHRPALDGTEVFEPALA